MIEKNEKNSYEKGLKIIENQWKTAFVKIWKLLKIIKKEKKKVITKVITIFLQLESEEYV